MFRLRKRTLVVGTAMALVLLLTAAVGATPTALDIDGHWAAAEIRQAISQGYVQVGSDGRFRPNDPVTGSEFAAWLTSAGKPASGQSSLAIGRADAAKILVTAFGAEAEATALTADQVSSSLNRFSDSASITSSLRPYTALAVTKGWLEGTRQATAFQGVYTYMLEPGTSLTRAQGVVLMLRALGRDILAYKLDEYVGSKACLGCHTDKYVTWSETGHAHMLVPTSAPGAVPASEKGLTAEWKQMLQGAEYVVAGQRFLKRNPDGTHSYLPFVWSPGEGTFKASSNTSNWEASCAGCHSVGFNVATNKFADENIGCESCHGPGRDHILGKGDPAKIVNSTADAICAQCHTAGKSPTGKSWPVGFRPGMTVEQTGYKVLSIDPAKPATSYTGTVRQYPYLVVSKHAQSLTDLRASNHAQDRCYECHSADYRLAAEQGQPIAGKDAKTGITCVTCHEAHEEGQPGQLRVSKEEVCADCHNSEIPVGGAYKPGATVHHPQREMLNGYGAIGVAQTLSVHLKQGVTCVDCHMTNGNHEFKVILPKDAKATKSADSCDSCHSNSTPDIRQSYIDMWQNTVKAKIDSLKPRIAADQKKAASFPTLKILVDQAYTDVSMVEADGSSGAHNFEYAMKILNQADTYLTEFESKAK